jgi:hypothetical protein
MSGLYEELLKRITSRKPTEYKVILSNKEVKYVYCAFDAVIYAYVAGEKGEEVEIEAPVGDKHMKMKITPDTKLYVSFLPPSASKEIPKISDTPSSLCPYLRFFENVQQFENWKKGLNEKIQQYVKLISINEAFELVKDRIKNVYKINNP